MKRRTRVSPCPECGKITIIERAKPRTQRGGYVLTYRIAFSTCRHCFVVFNNDRTESFLTDLLENPL